MGLHLVIPLHLHRFLHNSLSLPPPLPTSPPPDPTRLVGPHTSTPQPLHGPDLRHHLHRNHLLRRRRDSRHPLVLAALQDHPVPVAPLFPPRHPFIGSGLLLVIHVLPIPIPPHFSDLFHHIPAAKALLFLSLQSLHSHFHVIPLARILTIISSPCNTDDNFNLFGCLRVPILDRDGVTGCLFSVRYKLPNLASEL